MSGLMRWQEFTHIHIDVHSCDGGQTWKATTRSHLGIWGHGSSKGRAAIALLALIIAEIESQEKTTNTTEPRQ